LTRRREKAQQPVGTRRAAREFAFRTLFEADRGGGDLPLEAVFTRAEGAMREGDDTFPQLNAEALAFARQLAEGFDIHRADVDATLRRTVRGWDFGQMAQTDLNILRLAVFEMLYTPEPHPPVIESAVRIARKFGGEDSGRFVNGVLGGLSRTMQAASRVPRSESEPDPGESGSGEESQA
jgi:N utilization substance protein B